MRSWDDYALRWKADRRSVIVEDPSVTVGQKESYLEYLGDEWGNKGSVDEFIRDFIAPHVRRDSCVAEIGCGGGRIAGRVAPACRQLLCFDVAMEMLRLCHAATRGPGNVVCLQIGSHADSLPVKSGSLDFIYSFDTCVHLDERQVFRYLSEAARTLKAGGKAVFHFASHETEGGWQHFASSAAAGVLPGAFAAFEYLDSHAFFRMAKKAGFDVLSDSMAKRGNFYYERDVVVLLGRPL